MKTTKKKKKMRIEKKEISGFRKKVIFILLISYLLTRAEAGKNK
jgi:hypothetical protein